MSVGARIAARIEYHGGHYHGWQAQPHLSVPTVQEALEAALPAKPTHEPVIKLSEMSIEQRRAYYQRQREAQARTTATEEGSGELEAKAST